MAWAADGGGNKERKEMREMAAGLGWAALKVEDSPASFLKHFFPFHVSVMDREIAQPTFPTCFSFPRTASKQQRRECWKILFLQKLTLEEMLLFQ